MNISVLLGKTLTECSSNKNDYVSFTTTEGKRYKMLHYQDCCESVTIEDIVGDLNDLVGSPLTIAEESVNGGSSPGTWTFYRLATVKGYVTIRWYGESNGYYSESVDFEEI